MTTPTDKRIGELEDTLKQRDQRIEELKAERDAATKLAAEMREHVEDHDAVIERWIEAFNMELNDKGEWCWGKGLAQELDERWDAYTKLLNQWNRIVPGYNAIVAPRRRNFGRPLAASEAQQADVLKRHKARQSLRSIAEDTGLGLRTVRTIIDKPDRVDRATLARLERVAPDKAAEARARRSRKDRAALPKRINETLKRGANLVKAAKGLS